MLVSRSAVDQLGHGGTEQVGQSASDVCVSSTVSCSSAAHTTSQSILRLAQDDGDLYGMVDIQLAAAALLIGMLLRRKAVGALRLRGVLVAHYISCRATRACSNCPRRSPRAGHPPWRNAPSFQWEPTGRPGCCCAPWLSGRSPYAGRVAATKYPLFVPLSNPGCDRSVNVGKHIMSDAESAHPRKAENSTRARIPSNSVWTRKGPPLPGLCTISIDGHYRGPK